MRASFYGRDGHNAKDETGASERLQVPLQLAGEKVDSGFLKQIDEKDLIGSGARERRVLVRVGEEAELAVEGELAELYKANSGYKVKFVDTSKAKAGATTFPIKLIKKEEATETQVQQQVQQQVQAQQPQAQQQQEEQEAKDITKSEYGEDKSKIHVYGVPVERKDVTVKVRVAGVSGLPMLGGEQLSVNAGSKKYEVKKEGEEFTIKGPWHGTNGMCLPNGKEFPYQDPESDKPNISVSQDPTKPALYKNVSGVTLKTVTGGGACADKSFRSVANDEGGKQREAQVVQLTPSVDARPIKIDFADLGGQSLGTPDVVDYLVPGGDPVPISVKSGAGLYPGAYRVRDRAANTFRYFVVTKSGVRQALGPNSAVLKVEDMTDSAE